MNPLKSRKGIYARDSEMNAVQDHEEDIGARLRLFRKVKSAAHSSQVLEVKVIEIISKQYDIIQIHS